MYYSALILICAAFPGIALAHSKWLVENYQNVILSQHGTLHYSIYSPAALVWAVFSLLVIVVAGILHHYTPEWQALNKFAERYRDAINRIAQITLGVFLVCTALFWNVVILPSEAATNWLLEILKYAQIAIGLMFLGNVAPRYASIGLIILTSVITIASGLEAILENVILFALAFYFYLIHTDVRGRWLILKRNAVDIVRIGAGVSLIVLAFTEKLLYPELSLQFLVEHHWNFMQPFFPWFNDALFVFSTGCAEALFGIVFLLGYMTRTTTIVIGLFFAASVTTMLYQANVWEVEDFVVYTAAIILFFFSYRRPTLPQLLRHVLNRA